MRKITRDLWADANRVLDGELTIGEFTAKRECSERYARNMLRVARATEADRLPGVSPRLYLEVLPRVGWSLARANREIARGGCRLRDHAGPMESVHALREQIDRRWERGSLGDLATRLFDGLLAPESDVYSGARSNHRYERETVK